jgi:hypothetical protein
LAECEVVEGTIEFSRTPDLSPFDQPYHTSQNKSIGKKKYLLNSIKVHPVKAQVGFRNAFFAKSVGVSALRMC